MISANQWNALHPVGIRVVYFPVLGAPFTHVRIKGMEPVITQTRSLAWDIPSGTSLVSVEGKSGGVSIQHVLPIPEGFICESGLHMSLGGIARGEDGRPLSDPPPGMVTLLIQKPGQEDQTAEYMLRTEPLPGLSEGKDA